MIRIRLLEHRELPVIFLTAKGKTPDKVKGLRGGAAVFSGKMTRPLRKLSQATQELSEGNYDRRVQPGGRDEVALLMQDFNHMADELQENITERICILPVMFRPQKPVMVQGMILKFFWRMAALFMS